MALRLSGSRPLPVTPWHRVSWLSTQAARTVSPLLGEYETPSMAVHQPRCLLHALLLQDSAQMSFPHATPHQQNWWVPLCSPGFLTKVNLGFVMHATVPYRPCSRPDHGHVEGQGICRLTAPSDSGRFSKLRTHASNLTPDVITCVTHGLSRFSPKRSPPRVPCCPNNSVGSSPSLLGQLAASWFLCFLFSLIMRQ